MDKKVRVYMRVAKAKNGYKVDASTKPRYMPLRSGEEAVPTASFALDLDIPESVFNHAEQVLAEIKIGDSTHIIGTEVIYPENGAFSGA